MATMSTSDMREYMRNYRTQRREEARASLGGVCNDCGTGIDLQFDHVDRTTKVDSIANLITNSKETLSAELAKCQLLCGDCHLKKSYAAGDLQQAQHGSTVMYKNGCRCELCAGHVREYNKTAYAERRDAAEYIQVTVVLSDLG